jgi:hypothetical protein
VLLGPTGTGPPRADRDQPLGVDHQRGAPACQRPDQPALGALAAVRVCHLESRRTARSGHWLPGRSRPTAAQRAAETCHCGYFSKPRLKVGRQAQAGAFKASENVLDGDQAGTSTATVSATPSAGFIADLDGRAALPIGFRTCHIQTSTGPAELTGFAGRATRTSPAPRHHHKDKDKDGGSISPTRRERAQGNHADRKTGRLAGPPAPPAVAGSPKKKGTAARLCAAPAAEPGGHVRCSRRIPADRVGAERGRPDQPGARGGYHGRPSAAAAADAHGTGVLAAGIWPCRAGLHPDRDPHATSIDICLSRSTSTSGPNAGPEPSRSLSDLCGCPQPG